MVFHLSKLNAPLLVLAKGAMVLSAPAQQSGQDIMFSSPKFDGIQAVMPSLTPQNSDLPILPDTLLAPIPAFASSPSPIRLPPPANPAEQQRLNKLQAERRNWMLMTPAEMFGVTPTDKLLQPPERDAFGREKKPTQMERYLDRETQTQAGFTNGWRSDQAGLPWSLSRDRDRANPLARGRDSTSYSAQNLAQFLDGQQSKNDSVNQNENSDLNEFDAFAQQKATKEKLEHVATMDRFRQMLQPSINPSLNTPSPNSQFFPVPKPVVNPNMTQPDFVPNPAGASFIPLRSSIGRPVGLTPLPGVVTPHLQPVVVPSWKPKPPPWVSQSP